MECDIKRVLGWRKEHVRTGNITLQTSWIHNWRQNQNRWIYRDIIRNKILKAQGMKVRWSGRPPTVQLPPTARSCTTGGDCFIMLELDYYASTRLVESILEIGTIQGTCSPQFLSSCSPDLSPFEGPLNLAPHPDGTLKGEKTPHNVKIMETTAQIKHF